MWNFKGSSVLIGGQLREFHARCQDQTGVDVLCCKKYDRTVTARSRFAVQGYVSNAFKELTGRLLDIKLLR